MGTTTAYADAEPARAEIDALRGPTVLEFGSPWCAICRATQPAIAGGMGEHAAVRHIKIEDGPGRALGRSFGVKLWPTLVFMRDGSEIARLVRPRDSQAIADALCRIARG